MIETGTRYRCDRCKFTVFVEDEGVSKTEKENGLCHKYIEQKMGRPVWTHEFAFKEVQEQVRKTVLPDFLKLCRGEEVKLNLE